MRKKKHEHANHERWLVSYADFITLLFAFFVIMYAISQADMAKLKRVSKSIQKAFGGAAAGTIDLQGGSGGATPNPFDPAPAFPSGRVPDLPAGKTNTATESENDLMALKERLEESVSLEMGLSAVEGKPEMLFDSRGLIIRLAIKDLFDPGKTEVHPDLQPLLDRIARIVATSTERQIRIEGHSDPSETTTAGFPSDWELSAARAAWVARYWLSRQRIDPQRIAIAGYSHFSPISNAKNEWGQSSNRRIEIIILNNLYDKPAQ